jgi:voltage-gated potassium channel
MPLFLITYRWFNRAGRYRVKVLLGFAVTIILVGAAAFSLTDHIGYGVAVYWAVTTATTVGYGDITPHNTGSQIVASVVMLTTIPTIGAIFALTAGAAVLDRVRRLFGLDTSLPHSAYTIVFGTHDVIPRVLEELTRAGDPVVLVSADKPAGLSDDIHFLAGDPTDEALMMKCDLHRANRALIACDQDSDTLVIAVAIHNIAPELEVFALTQSQAVARALRELGVTLTLSANELVGHTIAKSLETPSAGSLLLQLVDNTSFRLAEVPVDSALVSQPLSKARDESDLLVLGFARGTKVDLGVGDDPQLAAGDRLIVLEPEGAAS